MLRIIDGAGPQNATDIRLLRATKASLIHPFNSVSQKIGRKRTEPQESGSSSQPSEFSSPSPLKSILKRGNLNSSKDKPVNNDSLSSASTYSSSSENSALNIESENTPPLLGENAANAATRVPASENTASPMASDLVKMLAEEIKDALVYVCGHEGAKNIKSPRDLFTKGAKRHYDSLIQDIKDAEEDIEGKERIARDDFKNAKKNVKDCESNVKYYKRKLVSFKKIDFFLEMICLGMMKCGPGIEKKLSTARQELLAAEIKAQKASRLLEKAEAKSTESHKELNESGMVIREGIGPVDKPYDFAVRSREAHKLLKGIPDETLQRIFQEIKLPKVRFSNVIEFIPEKKWYYKFTQYLSTLFQRLTTRKFADSSPR